MTTPPPNSVEIEAKRLLRDLSHCPETAKEPLIWNALNSQRRSALEEAAKIAEDYAWKMSQAIGDRILKDKPHEVAESKMDAGESIAKSIRSLLEVKG